MDAVLSLICKILKNAPRKWEQIIKMKKWQQYIHAIMPTQKCVPLSSVGFTLRYMDQNNKKVQNNRKDPYFIINIKGANEINKNVGK